MKIEPSPKLKGDPARAATPQGLADRSALALIAMERAQMPMVVTDPRLPGNPIILANQAFLSLTGGNADEIIGRGCEFLQGPDTDPDAVAEMRDAVANQRECSVEILNYRKDGSTFWNLVQISPIHDDSGELIYFFGSQRDITTRRRAQEQEAVEHLLLKEVDHRAKNAMALVQAIVRLTKAPTADAYKLAVQGRVLALARAHELLAARRWQGAPLEEIVRSEVVRMDEGRIMAEGPEIHLPTAQVQPLTLLLHEMVSNAQAHGALSSPAGSLHVQWRSIPGDAPSLNMTWNEIGGPAPADKRLPGFGSFMIKAVVERQLGGSIDLAWPPEGLRAELQMPITRTH